MLQAQPDQVCIRLRQAPMPDFDFFMKACST